MTDEVYAFLSAPRKTREKIKDKRRKREELLIGMMGGAIRYDLPRVQSSPKDRMSEMMAEIDEIDQMIEKLKAQYKRQRAEIREACEDLPDPCGDVLTLYYIDGLQWADVARVLHKSESTIYRLRRQAVNELTTALT